MAFKNWKEEFIKRYKYIYENTAFIFVSYMYELSKKTYEEINAEGVRTAYAPVGDDTFICFEEFPNEMLNKIEDMLLTNKPFEETEFYKYLEELKNNKEFLQLTEKVLTSIKKRNERLNTNWQLTPWKLYDQVRIHISKQSGSLVNKEDKLMALDEYFRVYRYKNDQKIYTSGYEINKKDTKGINSYEPANTPVVIEPTRYIRDVGTKTNAFIKYLYDIRNHYRDNFSILTEKEKQFIYLEYHDELPWDFELECGLEYEIEHEKRYTRPNNTEPCGETFYIEEANIFVRPNDDIYKYFYLCPKCGYMINIPNEIIPEGMQKRIDERCLSDEYLFRKMELKSELKALEYKTYNKEKVKNIK